MNRTGNSRSLAFAAVTFTSLIWGFSFLSIKVAVAQIPPATLALYRFAIASVFLVTLLKRREPETRLRRKDVPKVLASGFTGVTLYFLFENHGVQRTSASAASIIVATIPIFTLLGSALAYRERLTALKVVGAVASFAGVYLVVGANFSALGNVEDLLGSLLMLGAVFAWVGYCFLTKPLSRDYSHLALVTYQTLLAMITLIPFSLMEYRQWRRPDESAVLNVLFLGVACSAMGYYLYVYAQEKLGVSLCSLFINLIPVVTVAASYFILEERVSGYQMAGGALVVLAVTVSELDLSWFRRAWSRSGRDSKPI